ncbi:hypothetical protein GCM10010282_38600 [Streptomyces roseolus]|nr:hypothetical protein GCM10010282_38600 [Streptomyces roseolus]
MIEAAGHSPPRRWNHRREECSEHSPRSCAFRDVRSTASPFSPQDSAETPRRLRAGLGPGGSLAVGDWLDYWFASKKRRKSTLNGYASRIRVHLKPRIGHIRLDRLNVGHLVEMFDGIADDNEVIAAENQARREQVARCKPSRLGRPVAAEGTASPPSGRSSRR